MSISRKHFRSHFLHTAQKKKSLQRKNNPTVEKVVIDPSFRLNLQGENSKKSSR